jgi:sulfur carrier protein ThiS adenylyltransferase
MKFSEIQTTLKSKKIGIAGAGGLGSNCAAALVRCGIGSLVIADFDLVEESNLNRQFYFSDQIGMAKVDALKENLLRINPRLVVSSHIINLNPEFIAKIFKDVDILVEAFDRADQKEMLIETAMEQWPERPLVVGSGMAGFGKTDSLSTKRYGELYICGDGKEEIGPENPPLAPRVGIVAHMQADIVLSILMSKRITE